MRLDWLSYADVEKYLEKKDSIILPIGSIEQHSAHGLLGTDFLIAWSLAMDVAKQMQIIVSVPIPFGIATHHLLFPGTISLRPTTLIALIEDVLESLFNQGFRQFFFINGHGGNTNTLKASFSQFLLYSRAKLDLINWWHLPEIKKKEVELFGNENGFHATISEISITRFLFNEAFAGKNGKLKSNKEKNYNNTNIPDTAWPLNPKAFRKFFPKGNMGSNPLKADKQKGKIIYNLAIASICSEMKRFLKKKY